MLAALSAACLAGPQHLSTDWDEWVGARSAENAVLHETMLQNVLPVYPVVGALVGLMDFLVVNPVAYWTHEDPPEAEEAGAPAEAPQQGDPPRDTPSS